MRESYIIDKNYNNSRFDKWFKTTILNIPQSLIEKILRKKKSKLIKKKLKPLIGCKRVMLLIYLI